MKNMKNYSFGGGSTYSLIPSHFGFTLAEVFITLGIIGVVAALTLPSLINKYKIKQLETSFKRSSANLENALVYSLNENSFSHLYTRTGSSTQLTVISDFERNEINTMFLQQLKIIKTASILNGAPADRFSYNLMYKNKIYFDDGSVSRYNFNYFPGGGDWYLLSDGSAIGNILFQAHNVQDGIKISIDTNGPFKGPNRIGYDLFTFNSGSYWSECCRGNKNGCPDNNYYGCYKYAKANQNPSDTSKGYWESLKL